jgi:hypothetical protein
VGVGGRSEANRYRDLRRSGYFSPAPDRHPTRVEAKRIQDSGESTYDLRDVTLMPKMGRPLPRRRLAATEAAIAERNVLSEFPVSFEIEIGYDGDR